MKRKRLSEEQIIGLLAEAEAGAVVTKLCRKHGMSSATYYAGKAKHGGLEVSEAKRLRALDDENAKVVTATRVYGRGCASWPASVAGSATELTSNAVLIRSGETKVERHDIAPFRPMQTGYVFSFNARMQDELLNETVFLSLAHAHAVIRAWAEDYNTERPHSSLGYVTQEAVAAEIE